MHRPIENLAFAVEEWTDDDQHVAEVLGRLVNIKMAAAAFREGVKSRPGRTVLLRHGTRVVRDSRRPEDLEEPQAAADQARARADIRAVEQPDQAGRLRQPG